MSLLLFTSGIKTGKTSSLFRYINGKNNIGGVLCPDDFGLRKIYNIQLKTYNEFESYDESKSLIHIHKYSFLVESFERMGEIINESLLHNEGTIFDEYGPLEMQGQGMGKFIDPFLESISNDPNSWLCLVIRSSLIDEFRKKFHINYKIWNFAELGDMPDNLFEYLSH